MVKPKMLQDDFMGDFYLGCPRCREMIQFPMCRNPMKYRPAKCSQCGEPFDWSDYERKEAQKNDQ